MSEPLDISTLVLRIVESAYTSEVGKEFALSGEKVLLGRGEECDITLVDVLISRVHAEVSLTGGDVTLADQESANGVWVGDRQVSSLQLTMGLQFRVGTTVLELAVQGAGHRPEGADPSVSAPPRERVGPSGQTLLDEGEMLEVSGNNPFLLDDPELTWIVEQGRVEIFTVEVKEGKVSGARSHYLTVEQGSGFMGIDLERFGAGYGFLAVGKTGTALRAVRTSRMQQLAGAGFFSDEIITLIDTWVRGIARSLTAKIIPGPLIDIALAPDQDVSMELGQKAGSNRGVLWLEVERGDLLYIGMEDVSFGDGELFPLTPESWVEASNEFGVHTDLVARDSASVIGSAALWTGLALFHRMVCQCEFINKRLAVVDEFQRLKSKSAYSKVARDTAIQSLASVLRTEPITIAEVGEEEDAPDETFRAMKLVGEAQGIEVKLHPTLREDLNYEDRVGLIAKASGIRTRVVVLRGEWWKLDQGPILARMDGPENPVALIPSGTNSYKLVDPSTGRQTKINEKNADAVWGFGHALYRKFPDGKVRVKDLVRFGSRGLSREVISLIVMGITVGILGSLTPYFTGRIFDSAIPAAEKSLLAQFVFALVIAALASAAFRLTQSIAVLRIQGKMDYSIQAALWDRLLNLPSTFFRKYSAGDLADRAAGINAIRGLVAGAGVASILGAFSSIFYVALMVSYSGQLSLLAIGLTILFVSFTTAANYIQLRYQRKQFARQGRISGLVLQLISGVSKLRVAGAENHAFRVWAQKFAELRKTSYTIGRIQNNVAVFGASFPIFSSMAIFFALVTMKSEESPDGLTTALSTGEFIAFTAAFGLFLGAMQALSSASLSMLQALPIYERFKPILTTPAEVDETSAYPGRLSGAIELSHIHFRYQKDGAWIIKDLTLKILPGEFVAFVGPSGSGKSTVMRLMLGFEVPEKGSVYYDGQDLGNLDLREVRQQMGVVLQESRVLPSAIFHNIVGGSSRTLDEAWEAAEMAGLADDIREMPMGMHTYVSEGGGGLSGGQRQRLLIARSVINKPRIIFMDEATSALDNRTQAVVTESLDGLRATRIVIAHRLSTIINANRICYLEDGEIMESGTYSELMELGGRFAELARRQLT